jgi:hypothetical protein
MIKIQSLVSSSSTNDKNGDCLKTLYDVIDRWTLEPWDRASIELVLSQVAQSFYARKKILLLLEEIWDVLEHIDNPHEYMTEERKKQQVEMLLRDESVEHCAMAIQLEISEPSNSQISVLNADDIIQNHPEWFDEYAI